jgi:hypothetical protein
MGNKKRAFGIGFFILIAAVLSLAPQLHPRDDTRGANGTGGAAGAAGIAGVSLGSSGNSAGPTAQPHTLQFSSQPAVVAGGVGAGRAKPRVGVQPPQTTGVPSEVLAAAATGLPFFLSQIPAGSKELYGFSQTDNLSRAQLGGALGVHTITPAALHNSSSDTTVSSILSETTMWFFPVLLDGESKAMLVVDQDGGTWKAVSLGYAGLGHELNKLLAQWPPSQGFHPQLVAVFQAKQFYFTVPEVDNLNLTAISLPQAGLSTSASLNNYGNLTVLSRSLTELRPIVLRAEMQPTR